MTMKPEHLNALVAELTALKESDPAAYLQLLEKLQIELRKLSED